MHGKRTSVLIFQKFIKYHRLLELSWAKVKVRIFSFQRNPFKIFGAKEEKLQLDQGSPPSPLGFFFFFELENEESLKVDWKDGIRKWKEEETSKKIKNFSKEECQS